VARKLNIPKAKQIQGLRKAIANRKTPRQFIPSMKKRLAKITAALAILFALTVPARAQQPVTVQPSQQSLAPAGTPCTGSVQSFNVNNRNQTQHNVTISSVSVTSINVKIFGIDSNGNPFLISDTGTIASPVTGSPPILSANGYFPQIQVQVLCLPVVTGTFALGYSGTSASSIPQIVGGSQLTQETKNIAVGAPANTNLGLIFQTPWGDSFGYLTLFNGAGGLNAAAHIQIFCLTSSTPVATETFTFPLSEASPQVIAVPDFACPVVQLNFIAGGASTDAFTLDYSFLQPGFKGFGNYTHITGTTATIVKAGPGVVHTVVVGTPAAGTISLFDLASGSCSGTPVTNIVSVITATTTFPAAPEIYDVLFANGICVKASAAMDITINSQ